MNTATSSQKSISKQMKKIKERRKYQAEGMAMFVQSAMRWRLRHRIKIALIILFKIKPKRRKK